jgi:hypothetical protein
MQPITSTHPSSASTPRDLHDDATCTTRSRASISLEARLGNPSPTCFHVKQVARSQCVSHTDLSPSVLWRNQKTEVCLVLRPKSPKWIFRFGGSNRETIDLGFNAQPRNTCSSCYARYRPYTTSPDHPIVQPPSTRPVLDHPRSSASGMLLLHRSSSLSNMSHLSPTHHETRKRDSRHKQR